MSLQVRHLVAGHGKVAIVRGIDLDAPSGSVVALLGPNGAGKTTLMMTLAGLLPSQGGTVSVGGQRLADGNAEKANRAGLVLVPDNRALFGSLTVADNLAIARRRGGMSDKDIRELFPSLQPRWKVAAGSLSGGEQQMLAVARALVQKPKVLLIDEMSMGLAPVIVEKLLPVVRHIADTTGATVILVEQHVQLALEVADQAIVLVHGEVTLRGGADEIRSDPARLEAAYLGGDVAATTS
ncbi:ABC transporter ATP-binding protein [Aldersonia kunmingensis]|uniref:ABC transporter ATP-binding protein n=1 Tax=Aldersonia kunmingensis TaxID=408066 RepID=UPI000830B86E|nr:ABC transporter ATP-binding protein [Aldersonia kunmingensis]